MITHTSNAYALSSPSFAFEMNVSDRSWGALVQADGRVRFRLWAPTQEKVSVRIVGVDDFTMQNQDDGWHELLTDRAMHGSEYWYVLQSGERVPDPASTYQPQDVCGPSRVTDLSRYHWKKRDWKGREWCEAIIYELHVGTFSREGSFRGVIDKLPYLKALGVTAIELMPVADFFGARSWGYDGVMPYAPDSAYGQPEDLQALVDEAHGAGLMVFLDVVYNHFGPKGNYLHQYAPHFFTERHQTPWGAGINFDGARSVPVRQFCIENALYWLQEFRFDGLRIDAVHAIADNSPRHIVDAIGDAVRERIVDRHVHLILENENNEAHRLMQNSDGDAGFTAQWNDDIHHVLHAAATHESAGYYAEYHGDMTKLAKAIAEGFVFQGELMTYRGSPRGERSAHLPPTAFVAFTQNHDQVGNRAFGERLVTLASWDALRAVTAISLLSPQIPMLFMGEEWGATQPFPFFCDFDGELADAVRNGRRAEFARFPEFADPVLRERIPDPNSLTTFESAKLRWVEVDEAKGRTMFDWYKMLLTIRHRDIVLRLPSIQHGGTYEVFSSGAIAVQWHLQNGENLKLIANLTNTSSPCDAIAEGHVIWREGERINQDLSPWFVEWSLS
jgi:maltooligosyltrehalose trehalohydrolase